MALKVIPARGGLGWAWCTPAWAVTARPTTSAVAAMVNNAVIQRRIRRVSVIAVSFYSMCPRGPGITGGSKPRRRRMGSRVAGPEDARPRPGVDQEPDSVMMPAGTEASRLSPPEPCLDLLTLERQPTGVHQSAATGPATTVSIEPGAAVRLAGTAPSDLAAGSSSRGSPEVDEEFCHPRVLFGVSGRDALAT